MFSSSYGLSGDHLMIIKQIVPPYTFLSFLTSTSSDLAMVFIGVRPNAAPNHPPFPHSSALFRECPIIARRQG